MPRRIPEIPADTGAEAWAWMIAVGLMVAILCTLAQLTIPSDRWKLGLFGLASVGTLASIFASIRLLAPGLLTPLIFVGFQVPPALFFTVSLFMASEAMLGVHPLPPLLDNPGASYVALILPSLGFLLFALFWRLFGGSVKNGEDRTLAGLVRRLPDHFDWLLIVAALFQFSQWVTTDDAIVNTLPAYLVRTISRSMGFMPFFAGLAAFRFKRATWVWCMVFVVSIVLSFFTGSRGYAFLPLIPFLIGLFIGLPTWKHRVRVGLVLSPFLAAAFGLAGLVGQIRGETGRLSLSDVAQGGLGRFFEVSKERVKQESEGGVDEVSMTESGVARLVNWPNIAVPVMTPEKVGYRGFGDIGLEVQSFWELGKFSGRAYWSNVIANEYGFMVNESTSVEFGIAADGASRAGSIGGVFYGLVAAIFLVSLEMIGARLFANKPGVFTMCLGALGTTAYFDMIRTGLFSSVRSANLGLLVVGSVFLLVDTVASSAGETRCKNE